MYKRQVLGGALWAIVPGLLKALFNVHEVVSSLMMNWIAYWTVYYTVPKYFKGEYLETESRMLPETATLRVDWLSDLFGGSYINLGIILALVAVFIVWFILNRPVLNAKATESPVSINGVAVAIVLPILSIFINPPLNKN